MQKRIAVTGGIGSGKSTVLKIIQSFNFPVFSCDEIYKVISDETEYVEKIKEFFPSAICNGKINRKKLGEIIFQDSAKRKILNGLAHPIIINRLKKEMESVSGEYVFAEVPLLFEGGYENDFDYIIVVMRNLEMRKNFVIQRDQISEEEFNRRITAQFNYDNPSNQEYFQKIGAFVVTNDRGLEELKDKTFEIINFIKNEQ